MPTLLASALLAAALAGGTVVDWTVTPPLSGSVTGSEVLVESADAGSFPLVVIERPGVGAPGWVVETEVRYEGVGGLGYLEMWSVLEDGSRYFSRTLGTEGTMAALTGDSPARPAELPFFLDGDLEPVRLEVNLVLPEGGRVWVGPLRLSSLPAATPPATAGPNGGAWWGEEASPLAGVAGGLVGLLGALVGVLGGMRRSRRLVLAMMVGVTAAGGSAALVGLVGWLTGQPPRVVLPLILLGGGVAGLFGGLLPVVRSRYVADELRKLAARDLVR